MIICQQVINFNIYSPKSLFINNLQKVSIVLFIAPFLFAPFSYARENSPAPIIQQISIEGNSRTLPEIIQRELLFSIGDTLNPQLLAESERLLRRLLFLGNVSITAVEKSDSTWVNVAVQDLYSRALSPLFSGEPGEFSYGLIGLDYNFMGRGQTARLAFEHRAISGNQFSVLYQVPRLSNSNRDLTTSVTIGSEGHNAQVSLSRPFRSLADKRAYGLSTFTQQSVQRLYSEQILTERYTDELNGFNAWATYSFGKAVKWRPGVRLAVSDRRFTPTRDFTYAPMDRRRVLPNIGLTIWHPQYEKTRFLRALGQTEDVQIGSWLTTRLGLAHTSLGSDRNFVFYSAQVSPRLKLHSNNYLFMTAFVSGRQIDSHVENLYTLLQFQVLSRVRIIHSLSMLFRWDAIHNFEDSTQLLLGLNSGLRGYAPRRFDGTRRFLFNFEVRPTFYQHPFYILAGALFIDGGSAWTPPDTSPNLKLSTGLGGRLGLPRIYNTPVMRLDLAYALEDKVLQISFGIGHFF